MEEREKIAHRVLYTDFVSSSPDIAREKKKERKNRHSLVLLALFRYFRIEATLQRLEIPESDDEA